MAVLAFGGGETMEKHQAWYVSWRGGVGIVHAPGSPLLQWAERTDGPFFRWVDAMECARGR